ncbi:uncharacterized protein N7459_004081 [Penicillium hispanicum]|uniref:uncharacterized protein n=1 Tax=Penicillium hispanicum TaxID=1080232 RepID=UPI00253FFBD0|nr:uncharacterized protein N7459_004081 [Penicillium hispanicum]KAJ5584281.1 hypothetical protein N7459_004081 [Penicillium hispanicum]
MNSRGTADTKLRNVTSARLTAGKRELVEWDSIALATICGSSADSRPLKSASPAVSAVSAVSVWTATVPALWFHGAIRGVGCRAGFGVEEKK